MVAKGAGGRILAGRYRLESKLGEGAFGTVWRATDQVIGHECAIKLMRSELMQHKAAAARFEREGQVLVGLDHPNIARAYELVDDPPDRFLVMEFVPGTTLQHELIDRAEIDTPLTFEEILDISDEVGRACTHAHHQGLVHRDLKPANVMLTPYGDVKLLDFGVVRLVHVPGDRQTTVGRIVGTVQYLSPEQAMGLPVDYRSDIFALASIVFEMVTLRKPWVRDDDGDPMPLVGAAVKKTPNAIPNIIQRIREAPRPRASQYRADFPEAADVVLQRGMAIDPNERPKSAFALVEALREALPSSRTTVAARPRAKTLALDAERLPGRSPFPGLAWAAAALGLIGIGAAAFAFGLGGYDAGVQAGREVPIHTDLVQDSMPPPQAAVQPLAVPKPAQVAPETATATPKAADAPLLSKRRRSRGRRTPTASKNELEGAAPTANSARAALRRAKRAPHDQAAMSRLRSVLKQKAIALPPQKRSKLERCIVSARFSGRLSELETCVQMLERFAGS